MPTDDAPDRSWIADGHCWKASGRGTPKAVKVYFEAHKAKDVLCNGGKGMPVCPVKEKCFTYAKAAGVKFGVWGGVRFNGDQGDE